MQERFSSDLLRALCVFGLLCFSSLENVRAEGLSVRLQKFVKKRYLQFVVTAETTNDDCEASLYAATRRSFLSGDYENATLLGSVSVNEAKQTILLYRIPLFRNGLPNGRRLVHYQVTSNCDSESYSSRKKRFLIPKKTNSGGLISKRGWLRRVVQRVLTDSISLVNAFPGLTFDRAVDLRSPGTHSNTLYAVQQTGEIVAFEDSAAATSKSIFLDISHLVSYNFGEQGLLGLVFHPDVETNREFFVYYTEVGTDNTVIARYRINESDERIADTTEERILYVEQPAKNHNGASMHFGPDGFLYVSLGDGGIQEDPLGHGQNRGTLLGSVLRIDVDSTDGDLEYAIPEDNPFVGNTEGYREEIYAYGFRNPWRMSFDSQNGTLWLADVGYGTLEEIDIVKKGKNYGWRVMEGSICFAGDSCNKEGLVKPVIDYGRSLGQSVVGGFVYRSTDIKALRGFFLFADYLSGRIWAVRKVGRKAIWTQLVDTELFIPSFGQDSENQVYVLGFDGSVYRLVESAS